MTKRRSFRYSVLRTDGMKMRGLEALHVTSTTKLLHLKNDLNAQEAVQLPFKGAMQIRV